MSTSPFMTPGQSRLRRARAEQRRRRRRRIFGATLLVIVVAVAVALTAGIGSGKSHGHAKVTREPAVAVVHAQPAHSADGLVLRAPALKLSGIATPQQNPVKTVFREPPRAGLLFNLTTGEVLWQRHAYERVPIASLTKMMTALLTVKAEPPDAPVLVTKQAVDASGSKVGVLPLGHHIKLETMLYGLLLPSGNDAAIALAQHVAGSESAFVHDMNAQAARLGMGCTRYSSPSGYYNQGNFSCAADLALLAHVDMEQPRIASIVHTYSAVLPFPIKGGKLYLYNNNPLLIYKYPGVTGLKTGFTEAAGRCLVATAERHGVRLGVVVLNSEAPGTQARELLDAGFRDVYHQSLAPEAPFPPGV